MANKSLGSLTLDLIAKIGGFTDGMTQAERVASSKQAAMSKAAKQRAAEMQAAWKNAQSMILKGFAGFGAIEVFKKFIDESVEAQNNQAQLAAAIKSTGGAAGYTQQQLNDMATSMTGVISDDDITKAQTAMLKFTNVVGVQYAQAIKLAGDLSVRSGMDMSSAADVIGKALENPAKNLKTLKQYGVDFSDSQKVALQSLVDTGNAAQAQAIILAKLQDRFGGAADAARETLGGALKTLQNTWNNLFEGNATQTAPLVTAINDVTNELKKPETQAAFDGLLTFLSKAASLAIQAATGIEHIGESLAYNLAGGYDEATELQKKIQDATQQIKNIQLQQSSLIFHTDKGDADAAKRILILQSQIVGLKKVLSDYQAQKAGGTPSASSNIPTPIAPHINLQGMGETITANQTAQAYIDSLNTQLGKVSDLSMAQQALAKVNSDAFKKADGENKLTILSLATRIDQEKKLQEVLKGRKDAESIIARAPTTQENLGDKQNALTTQYQDQMKQLDDFRAKDTDNEKLYLDAKAALNKEYNDNMVKLRNEAIEAQYKDSQTGLQAMGNTMDSLADIVETVAGKNNKLYESMFIASKIFAIAQSGVAIAQGMAQALANPWPENLVAVASVAAQGAAIAADIQAISYGGARASGGEVSAGSAYTVGELGRELFVPKQSGFIVPNDMLNSQRQSVNIHVINNLDPAIVGDFMQTPSSDPILVNSMRRNSSSVRSVLR